jgi:hypothetical protein
MTFTVTRSGVLTGTDTVDVATSDDTATTADGDYTANSTTLTFNPNDTTMTFTVDLTADSKVELDEMFNVTLSNPSTGGVIGDGDGVGTIVNDDGASITFNDVSQQEGDSGSPDFTFTATLDFAVDVPVTLDYVSADDTATTGDSDYSTSSGQLSFDGTASETETVTVSVNGDTKVELDETFFVNLSNLAASGRNVTIGDSQGEGTIENDDSASLTINDVSQDEGDVATTSFLFTVTLNNEVDTAFTVDFDSADVTATVADSDYAANSGTLNFAGMTDETQTITIDVTGDTTAEVDETFFVNLSTCRPAAGTSRSTTARACGRSLTTTMLLWYRRSACRPSWPPGRSPSRSTKAVSAVRWSTR